MININKDIRDLVHAFGYEETLVFDNPDYDEAIIGVTCDGRAVYDYNAMIHCLIEQDNISEDEAVDFIEYNTIQSIPYAGEYAPIVIYTFRSMED